MNAKETELIALYAAYANHQAIQKKVPLTFHSWKREFSLDFGQKKPYNLHSAHLVTGRA